VTKSESPKEIVFEARGRLLSSAHKPLPEGDVHYRLVYRLTDAAVEIVAGVSAAERPKAPIELIVPVVSRGSEAMEQTGSGAIRISKPKGRLSVTTDAKRGFAGIPKERTFNLVPGFECVPLRVGLEPGGEVRVRLESA